MMFFKCKICSAKDAHIASLRAQIEDLRRLTIPENSVEPTVIQLESDGILSAQQHVIEVDDAEIAAERDRLLSGNYN